MGYLMASRIAALLFIAVLVLYTFLRGDGNLPWWEKLFLLVLGLEYLTEAILVSAVVVAPEPGAIFLARLCRIASVYCFCVSFWIRTVRWVRMRDEGRAER